SQGVRGLQTSKGQLRPHAYGNSPRVSRSAKALGVFAIASSLFSAEPGFQSRVVKVEKQDIVPVYSAYNYSTTVVLPDKEEVMEIEAGEKTFWSITKTAHTVTVKPLLAVKLAHKKIDPTNINIIVASGNVYSIVVSEIS